MWFMCTGLREVGHSITNEYFFDTVTIQPLEGETENIKQRAAEKEINLRYHGNGLVRNISLL